MSDFAFISIVFLGALLGILFSVWYIKKETKKILETQKSEIPFDLIKKDLEVMREKFEQGFLQMATELVRVQEVGRTIKEFQDILRAPKLRGNLGEEGLRDLLAQILPKENFFAPYKFENGKEVDAIIKTNQGLIPIDAKFPMENFKKFLQETNEQLKSSFEKEFKRDIKKHIDDISKKYILPQEGTIDFAIMYLPSEAIFNEILFNHQDVVEYSREKKVLFVSPNSFYYFLKLILIGIESNKIESNAKKILEGIKGIQQEAMKFDSELAVLGNHIENTKNASERVKRAFEKLVQKIKNVYLLEESAKNQEDMDIKTLEKEFDNITTNIK